jgi:hypothetical protein
LENNQIFQKLSNNNKIERKGVWLIWKVLLCLEDKPNSQKSFINMNT